MGYSGASSESLPLAMSITENQSSRAPALVAQLQDLEYAIRRSIAVREDQEDAADCQHIEAACRLGIQAEADMSKGDVLAAVQTRLRAAQADSSA